MYEFHTEDQLANIENHYHNVTVMSTHSS